MTDNLSFRIEVGKTYRNRSGAIISIVKTTTVSRGVTYYLDESDYPYFEDGTAPRFGDINHDLIEVYDTTNIPTESKLVLALGKRYRNERGDIVTLVQTGRLPSGPMYFLDINNVPYNLDGKTDPLLEQDLNLVSECEPFVKMDHYYLTRGHSLVKIIDENYTKIGGTPVLTSWAGDNCATYQFDGKEFHDRESENDLIAALGEKVSDNFFGDVIEHIRKAEDYLWEYGLKLQVAIDPNKKDRV